MVLKTECRCIDSSLKSILDAAIHNLEKESIGTRTDDYEKLKIDLERHAEETRDKLTKAGFGHEKIEEVVSLIEKNIPRDPIFKQFDDLKTWLNECECSETDVIDWTQFPYHDVGYKEPVVRTGKAGEACIISPSEKQELDIKLTQLANKYVYSLRDPVFLTDMKNKYGDKKITASNVRYEVVKRGIMSEQEMTEFNEIANELDTSCGRDKGKTRNIHDTRLLYERHEAGLLTEKREKYFGKLK